LGSIFCKHTIKKKLWGFNGGGLNPLNPLWVCQWYGIFFLFSLWDLARKPVGLIVCPISPHMSTGKIATIGITEIEIGHISWPMTDMTHDPWPSHYFIQHMGTWDYRRMRDMVLSRSWQQKYVIIKPQGTTSLTERVSSFVMYIEIASYGDVTSSWVNESLAVTHDQCDPSKNGDPFDPWPTDPFPSLMTYRRGRIPLQVNPSPEKPRWQVHVKVPIAFAQSALSSHPPPYWTHSFTSDRQQHVRYSDHRRLVSNSI